MRPTSLGEKDTYFSYMPAAHVYEQNMFSMVCLYGMRMGFYGGNPDNLLHDMAVLKPDYFASVPRIFNKVFGAFTSFIDSKPEVKALIEDKLKNLRRDGTLTHPNDHLLLPLRNMMGNRLRVMCTASAPISVQVMETLKVALSCVFCELYGLTETAGVTNATA